MAMLKHSFGSDNHSGVHPLIMKAIEDINHDFNLAYGEDSYTEGVLKNLENLLGGNCKALFVFNGTVANAVALSTFCKTYNSILAPRTAHILVDECGAVEKLSGCKIVPLNCKDGKVTPKDVEAELEFGDQHHTQPAILSISEPTELGTLYTAAEIKALADLMHKHGCYLHVDGSRIANAAAALKMPYDKLILYNHIPLQVFVLILVLLILILKLAPVFLENEYRTKMQMVLIHLIHVCPLFLNVLPFLS